MPVPHKGSQMPPHRVLFHGRCTDATHRTGWAQTAAQRETGGFTVLHCALTEGLWSLAKKIL